MIITPITNLDVDVTGTAQDDILVLVLQAMSSSHPRVPVILIDGEEGTDALDMRLESTGPSIMFMRGNTRIDRVLGVPNVFAVGDMGVTNVEIIYVNATRDTHFLRSTYRMP